MNKMPLIILMRLQNWMALHFYRQRSAILPRREAWARLQKKREWAEKVYTRVSNARATPRTTQ